MGRAFAARNHPVRIRLSGIDCPEKSQAYGQKAKHAASDLAFGKEVMVQTHGHDKYKRTLGDVILPDGMNLNQELVKQGLCWWYRKYAPGNTVLEGLEQEVRDTRIGLWTDPQPMPPWEWQRAGERRVAGLLPLYPKSPKIQITQSSIHRLLHRTAHTPGGHDVDLIEATRNATPTEGHLPRALCMVCDRRRLTCPGKFGPEQL